MARAKRPSELLAPGEYEAMAETQKGVCAICGASPVTRALNVDHNHRTMQRRGLLCTRCNRALPGEELLPKGEPLGVWLFKALKYVNEWET